MALILAFEAKRTTNIFNLHTIVKCTPEIINSETSKMFFTPIKV